MKALIATLALTTAAAAAGPADYPIQAVPFTQVTVRDEFWSPRLETNRTVTIPYAFKMCKETGRIENFDVAAKKKPGGYKGYFFNDSDVYKVIEGAAYALHNHPDPELQAYCDELIARIAAAQEPDGYLYASRTVMDPKNMPPGGKERWSDMAHGHELYCAGHLYEAAVAYHAATGKRQLLDVAIKNADLVASVFGPGKNPHPCGHPEIEIGLVKLYRETKNPRYLELAKFFIDTRGKATGRGLYGEYSQDHKPLLEQTEAVGHSVRAAYLFAGMADVAALTGERPYIDAIGRLWGDVVGTKMYLTGGIGSRGNNEGFGDPYELPNPSAYSETCASIANALWNHRLLLTHGDAKYADVLERVVYNGFLAGWSLKGDRFFYPNPLESRGAERAPWFACACCPSNVVRFVPSIPGYIYARRGNDLFVNLFIGGEATVAPDAGDVKLRQQTRYPWDGRITLTVEPAKAGRFTMRVRIPGWARDDAVPSDLYRFADQATEKPTLTVAGKDTPIRLDRGYAVIDREWKPGDTVELNLPMPVRRVVANPKVKDNAGRVAFQRGPLVYCFEGHDQAEPLVPSFVVADGVAFKPEFKADLLGGVTTLTGKARVATRKVDGGIEAGAEIPATAIPYYAWANRKPSPMTVWVAREPAAAKPQPAPTIARRAKASSSFGGDLQAISDQMEPTSSGDHNNPYLHWWPKKGTQEWIQYDFEKPARVSGIQVYWFDDTGRGECRLPKSWKLLAKVGGEWREVGNPSGYGVAADTYNTCRFDPVQAEGLRIEVQGREGWAGGVHEWKVLEAEGAAGAAPGKTVAPIMTRWAKDVNPEDPLPEHPRPQFVRENWMPLNGPWQWRAAKEGEPAPAGQDLGGTITVPFPVESALSGVMQHHERLWYRRTFSTPRKWTGQRLLLNFGAVDWEATVYINGKKIGEHRGGYDPFSFDITDACQPTEVQELIVGVYDPTDSGDQPRGKQTRKPEGIWYTPCTGIWQTVWLEAVPETRIDGLIITPAHADGSVRVVVNTAGNPAGLTARITAKDGKNDAGMAEAKPGQPATIKLASPKPWSPESPFLYGLSIELLKDAKVIHRASSYFGLRDIAVAKDDQGVNRLFLNGKPYFQVGPLDQGYWPDGIYTAPTDEALRFDIEETKRLGFNMTRKHVKVEPARWYYWADKLGLLVWQDMPSPRPPENKYTDEGKRQYERELRAMIGAFRNHPSIIMWVVFNEGWGQFDTPRFTELTKQLDPSRLVNNASGWVDAKAGDVNDIHSYPEPACPPKESARAAVLGEFGGLGLPTPGHMWKAENWGYKAMADSEALTRKYEDLLKKTYGLRDSAGLAAAVYTQITDVEIETNGLLTYDRAVVKGDAKRIAAANRGDFSLMPPPPVVNVLVPTSQAAPQEWRYTTTQPGAGWEKPDFDAARWASGLGGFGTRMTPGAVVGTIWNGPEIWIRREFALVGTDSKNLHLRLHHDEDCEVYLNGILAAKLSGWATDYEDIPLLPEAAAALRPGRNTIAIHCRQTSGGQFIDAGLVDIQPPAAAPGVGLLPNGSFELADGDAPKGWFRSHWGGEGKQTYEKAGRTGSASVRLSSDRGGDISWGCVVPVEMNSRYRLTGWIKTEGLDRGTGKGALLNLHNLQPVQTPAVAGTQDWTKVEVEFDTRYEDTVQVNCLLGGWGLSKGSAWFDDLSLTLLKRGEMPAPSISIDASQTGEPISKYIYGQFIEHLGRCIYGGIWAEMLEDRKFWHPVGHAESPWKPVGPAAAITMDRQGAFVGEHTPRVSLPGGGAAAGIRQNGLALKAGMDYVGRIWLAGDPGAGPVRVSLIWGPAAADRATVTVEKLTPEFAKTALSFRAPAAAADAALEITASGSGEFRIGTASLMPADNIQGFRADTLAALHELDSPVYRWPGGNFVSGYDWRDGIGDPDRRPPRKNPAWSGVEHNDVGLDEFMTFCRLLQTEPYIAVNTGLGAVENAVAELEYANGSPESAMGRLRAKHGHAEPYGVRFWGIGNEMYGSWQLGNVPLSEYTKRHNAFVDAMRKTDPNIIAIGVGAVGEWSATMLRDCADRMTHLSEHVYWQERAGLLAHVRQAPDSLRNIADAHRRYRKEIPSVQGRDIRICQDEWNYWYGPHTFGELGTRYFMKDALGCAAALNEFARNSDLYYMANYAQTVNVIGAIKTSKAAAALETTGLVLKLYRRHFGTIPCKVQTTPTIDAMAAWSADRKRLTVAVVNPSLKPAEIPLSLRGATLAGTGTRWVIADPDPMAYNDPDAAPRVSIREGKVSGVSDKLSVEPCSVTLLSLDVK